jgi:hypothetical protein
LKGGHENHGGDIIPAFTYIDKNDVTHTYLGKNLGGNGAATLANGCVTPGTPEEPADVCPNIEGDQAEVPDGMIKNEAGNCVTAPVGGEEQPPDSTPSTPSAVAGETQGPAAGPASTLPFTGAPVWFLALLGGFTMVGGLGAYAIASVVARRRD